MTRDDLLLAGADLDTLITGATEFDSTSSDTQSKLNTLNEKKLQKLDNLVSKTEAKTNTLNPEELQYSVGYALGDQIYKRDDGSRYRFKMNEDGTYAHDDAGNWIEQESEDPGRNVYIDNTKSGNMKLGLADEDKGFLGRYTPDWEQYIPGMKGYGWKPGPEGVTVDDGALMDVTLDHDKATALEYMVHSNEGQIANRAIGQGRVSYEDEKLFGSGKTEYTTPVAPLWNINAKAKALDPTSPLPKNPYTNSYEGTRRDTPITQLDIDDAKRAVSEGVVGRTINTVQSFGASFAKEAIVDAADWVGETLKEASGYGWDLGDEKVKSKLVNDFFGYDDRILASEMEKAKALGGKIYDAAVDEEVDIEYKDVAELIWTGIKNPELLGQSLGYVSALMLGFGKFTKAGKAAQAINAQVKAGKLSKVEGIAQIKDIRTLDKTKEFFAKNVGLVNVAAGNVNDQIDEFKENNNGKDPTITDVSRMLGTEIIMNGLDRFIDVGILKSPGMLQGITEVAKGLTQKQLGVIGQKVATNALKLTADMGKEAAQEYVQEMGQMFNAQFGTERYGDDVLDIITSKENVVDAGVAAGLGAGGAVQFKAVGGVGSVANGAADVVGSIKDKIPTKEPVAPVIEPEDREVVPVSDEEKAFVKDAIKLQNESTEALSKNIDTHLDNIVKAEDILERMAEEGTSETLEQAKNMLQTSKNAVTKLALDTTEDNVPAFGSVEDAEAMITTAFEGNTDPEKVEVLSEKLELIATKNGVSKSRFNSIKRDFEAVADEVRGEESTRSYTSYAKNIRRLMKTDNPDTKLIRKNMAGLHRIHDTSVAAVKEYDRVVTQAKRDIEAANSSGVSPKGEVTKSGFIKREVKYKTSLGKEQSAFINLENKKGKWSIKQSSLDIIADKKQTIFETKKDIDSLGITAGKVTGLKSEEFGVKGETLDPGNLGRNAKSRFDFVKPTKVVLSSNNTGMIKTMAEANPDRTYSVDVDEDMDLSADDRVYMQVTDSDVFVASNGVELLDNKLIKVLKKAAKAKATVVFDNFELSKKSAKAISNTTKRLRLAEEKFIEKSGRQFVYKPKELVEARNLEVEALRAEKSKKDALKTTATTKYEEAYENYVEFPTKENKETLDIAKEYVLPYFEGNYKTGTPESRLEKHSVKALNDKVDEYIEKEYEYEGAYGPSYEKAGVGMKAALDRRIAEEDTKYREQDKDMQFYREALELAKKKPGEEVDETMLQIAEHIYGIEAKATVDSIIKGSPSKDGTDMYSWDQEVSGKNGVTIKQRGTVKPPENPVGEVIVKKVDLYHWESNSGRKVRSVKPPKNNIKYTKKQGNQYIWKDRNGKAHTTLTKPQSAVGKVTKLVSNIGKTVKVVRGTTLNSVPGSRLGHTTNTYVDGFMKKLLKLTGAQKSVDKNNPEIDYTYADSPGRGLLFKENGSINKNVAVAMKLAIDELIVFNSKMLKPGYKSDDELKAMLGVEKINKGTRDLVGDKGMLKKTMVDSIGKAIAGHLGISAVKEGVDVNAFSRVLSDLANMAILAAAAEGKVKLNQDVMTKEYSRIVLGQKESRNFGDKKTVSAPDVAITFVKLASEDVMTDEGRVNEVVDATREDFDNITAFLPVESMMRKGPAFKPLRKDVVEKKANEIRKNKAGNTIPGESQQTMKTLMNTEWKGNMRMVNRFMELFEKEPEKLTARLGWVDISDKEATAKMTYEELDVQDSKNRDIEKSLEELNEIEAQSNDGKDVSMWFEYFFSKNGRFFIDSNTLNPQTDKQVHRFVIQPADHKGTYRFEKNGDSYKVVATDWARSKADKDLKEKDVTNQMRYAIAQGMGFAVDKKKTAKINELSDKLIEYAIAGDVKKLEEIENGLLEEGEYKELVAQVGKDGKPVLGKDGKPKYDVVAEYEIEHFGHMLQTMMMLKDVAGSKDRVATSFITAEYDAVTSGFAHKLLQLPILGKGLGKTYEFLEKVGLVKKGRLKELLGDIKNPSMNDVLGSGLQDNYQTLASGINVFDVGAMKKSQGSMKDKKAPKLSFNSSNTPAGSIWNNLKDALPQKDAEDGISSALRNVFKYPFMIFNYAGSIKAIRESLSEELTETTLKGILEAKEGEAYYKTAEAMVNRLDLVNEGTGKVISSIAELRNAIRTVPSNRIKIKNPEHSKAANLKDYLAHLVQVSYGEQMESILTENFGPYVKAQEKVNKAFKAMFRAYKVDYDKAINAKSHAQGYVSIDDKLAIIKGLNGKFPGIKAPFSGTEDVDNIAIYKEGSITDGSGTVNTLINQEVGKEIGLTGKTHNATAKIKEFEEAISAGSVIPTHYIDGSLISKTISGMKGIADAMTAIHDAVMPVLAYADEAVQQYNKGYIDVNRDYSIIGSIEEKLTTVLEGILKNSTDYDTEKFKVYDKEAGKEISYTAKSYIEEAVREVSELNAEVQANRKQLFKEIDEEGAVIMHAAGSPESVYEVGGKKVITVTEHPRVEIHRAKRILKQDKYWFDHYHKLRASGVSEAVEAGRIGSNDIEQVILTILKQGVDVDKALEIVAQSSTKRPKATPKKKDGTINSNMIKNLKGCVNG